MLDIRKIGESDASLDRFGEGMTTPKILPDIAPTDKSFGEYGEQQIDVKPDGTAKLTPSEDAKSQQTKEEKKMTTNKLLTYGAIAGAIWYFFLRK